MTSPLDDVDGLYWRVRVTLATAAKAGGEMLHLSWRRRPLRACCVLLLIDVSGSLRAHAPDLLRFACGTRPAA